MKGRTRFFSKILFTVFVLAVNLTLSNIPVPGINTDQVSYIFEIYSALGFVDTLSGGSLSSLSIAGFGVSSYITASIILQILGAAFPRLDQTKRGNYGKRIFQRTSIILALVITLAGSLTFALTFGDNGLYVQYDFIHVALSVISWLGGTFLISVLALKVEDYGVGNGISLVLMCNILSSVPEQLINATVVSENKLLTIDVLSVMVCILYVLAAYLQEGHLEVPIIQNRKMPSRFNDAVILPVPVNISGVLPVVYATVILSVPAIVVSIAGVHVTGIAAEILQALSASNWYHLENWYDSIGIVVYLLLVWLFCGISSKMTFSSAEIADRMKRNGDVIENVKPGEPTIQYLEKRRRVASGIGFFFLVAVSVLPDLVCSLLSISQVQFFGTSMLIVMSTLCDMILRIKAATVHRRNRYRIFGRRLLRKERFA